MQSAGKRGASSKRGKTWSQFKARENVESVQSAGKCGANAKLGKPCSQCKGRENVKSLQSEGKRRGSARQGKAGENVEPARKSEYNQCKACDNTLQEVRN